MLFSTGIGMLRPLLSLLGCLGPALFWLTFSVAGLLRDGYDPVRQTVSALALGDDGWLQTTNFAVFGVTLLCLSAWMWLTEGSTRVRALRAHSYVVFGICFLSFALLPTDAIGAPSSVQGRLHLLVLSVVSFYFPVGCVSIVAGFWRTMEWRAVRRVSVVGGAIGLAMAVFWVIGGDEMLKDVTGLYERAFIFVTAGWVEVVAIRSLLLSFRRRRREQPACGSG